jgi:hypothetical protein
MAQLHLRFCFCSTLLALFFSSQGSWIAPSDKENVGPCKQAARHKVHQLRQQVLVIKPQANTGFFCPNEHIPRYLFQAHRLGETSSFWLPLSGDPLILNVKNMQNEIHAAEGRIKQLQ